MSSKLVMMSIIVLSSAACAGSGQPIAAQSPNTAAVEPSHTDKAQPAGASTESAPSAAAAQDKAPDSRELELRLADIEAACAQKKGPCTPPEEVVTRLCRSADPDLALAMFRRGTPWKRVYARQDMDAWYAKKGRTRPRHVRYAEEMLVLVDRTDAGHGMKVSGFGNYDVYRWDGSCVSMMAGEVTAFRPSTPDLATIPWRRLGDKTQDALLGAKRISFRNSRRKQACKGISGRSSEACAFATHDLSRVIAEHIWTGGEIPVPTYIP